MTSVLIVDDHEPMRRLLHAVVGTTADAIFECGDGYEAVVIYQARHPDYVLMDIEMKGLDGIQATRQILQLDPGARVIIVTQHDDLAWRAAARSAGACGYVLKDDLKTLRQLLQADQNPPVTIHPD
jgi:DNA-binding NarL/FixJ family response regulator